MSTCVFSLGQDRQRGTLPPVSVGAQDSQRIWDSPHIGLAERMHTASGISGIQATGHHHCKCGCRYLLIISTEEETEEERTALRLDRSLSIHSRRKDSSPFSAASRLPSDVQQCRCRQFLG
ncbi:unnamed protein product [Somion occarium]|uniref:Uncharacterized protein n=1 Tax=Somion occarium TaxID=3059160 RepID=A0ABP1CWW7_9APHY